MAASFLLYLAMGLLALLVPNALISEKEALSENLFLAISVGNIIFLLLAWIAASHWWISSLAVSERKTGAVKSKELALYLLGLFILGCVAAWVKPVFSTDPYHYVAVGRQISEYGLSPYTSNLWASASDPIISQIGKMWFHHTTFFGPLALLLYAIANWLVSDPTLFNLASTLKAMWVPFYGLLFVVVWKLWDGYPLRASMALALLANPIMIWLCLVDGHVDLLVMTFLLLTLLALERGRPVHAALALAASASCKLVAIVCFPICLCWLAQTSYRKGGQFLASFALVYGGLCAALDGGEYRSVIAFTKEWQNLVSAGPVPRLLHLAGLPLDSIRNLSNLAFFLCVALLCAALLKGYFKTSPALPMALAMTALVFTRTYFQLWYTLWFWPLLWFAARKEKTYLAGLMAWTISVLLTWLVFYDVRIWVLTAGVGLNFFWVLRALRAVPVIAPTPEASQI